MRWNSMCGGGCLTLLAVSITTACGGNDGGGTTGPAPGPAVFSVVAVSPADGATGVEPGSSITATFNRAADPATVTAASIVVSLGPTALTAMVSYDPTARAARVTAPLLPGVSYRALVTTGVTEPGGGALAQQRSWSFATRSWQGAAIDQAGNVGFNNAIALDGTGRVHVGYQDLTNGDVRYATCAADCAAPANWRSVTVDAPGRVGIGTAIAVSAAGAVYLTYYDETNRDLKHASCAVDCTSPASWQTVTVDAGGDVGRHTAVAVDGSGRLHIAYRDHTTGNLKYAVCDAACSTGASWRVAVLDRPGFWEGQYLSLRADPTGRLHLTQARDPGIEYATCATDCTILANWQTVMVDQVGNLDYNSLAIDGSGGLHLSYRDVGAQVGLKYAGCARDCTALASWAKLYVERASDVTGGTEVGEYNAIAVGVDGRVHISYWDRGNNDLRYAVCVANCTDRVSWQIKAVDQAGEVGSSSAIAVDPSGRVRLVYFDQTNGDLRYIQ